MVEESAERENWHRCNGFLFTGCPGRMKPWRGTDGHSGTEWFYTCDVCRRTS